MGLTNQLIANAAKGKGSTLIDSNGKEVDLAILTQEHTNLLEQILIELKTTNSYFAEWSGITFDKEEIQ